MRHSLEREGVGHHTAAVDGGGDRSRLDLRGAGNLREHRHLAGVLGQPIAGGLPAPRPAEREHRRVLPRAVVLEPRRLGATLEVVLARSGLRRRRTGSSCSGLWRCEAHAIAISSSASSGNVRTTGSAWSGFAALRKYVTSEGSPHDSTICPPETATA